MFGFVSKKKFDEVTQALGAAIALQQEQIRLMALNVDNTARILADHLGLKVKEFRSPEEAAAWIAAQRKRAEEIAAQQPQIPLDPSAN